MPEDQSIDWKVSWSDRYLVIKVEPYPYPISLKGDYHYRSGSTKQEMKGAVLDRFLLKKQGRHWDVVPVPHVGVDELMIWNSGQLPEEWDISTLLQKHSSKPYNPDIANAFFRAGMIESWGRGIERINQSCKDAGVALPEFKYEHSDLWAVFSFVARDGSEKTPVKTTQETTREKMIALLKSNPGITRQGLAEETGITLDGVKYHLKELKIAGVIERHGSTKAGNWTSYRLLPITMPGIHIAITRMSINCCAMTYRLR